MTIDKDEWSALRPGRCAHGYRAQSSRWIRGWVGSRTGVYALENRKYLAATGCQTTIAWVPSP